jgi:hypothetical protein
MIGQFVSISFYSQTYLSTNVDGRVPIAFTSTGEYLTIRYSRQLATDQFDALVTIADNYNCIDKLIYILL